MMLGVDGLNLALMVADSGIVDSAIIDLLDRVQYVLAAENPAVNASVKQHLNRWRGQVTRKMTQVGEDEQFQQEIQLYQEVIHWDEPTFFSRISEVIQKLEGESAFYVQARQLVESKKNFKNPMFPRYFCDRWHSSLAGALKQAQLSTLEESKEKLLEDLYQRIETLQQMDSVTDNDDEQSTRRLWNMASAKLSQTDISVMKKHAAFLKKNREIQEIAENLGRMASQVDDQGLQQAQSETVQLMEEKADEATDDIVGIHPNDDLNRLLPNEALFLAHPDLEVVFYKHLIDKRLMNYRMQGKFRSLSKVTTTQAATREVDIEKGPFIICIDASGSMSGFPEQCAKAVAYALMQIALAENRECYVIIFSTQLITYELTRQDGLREMCDFLSYTFKGGTDLELAMSEAIKRMQGDSHQEGHTYKNNTYKNADLVVISDFMAPKQSHEIAEQVALLKSRQNRFHAITLSKYGNPQLMNLFDHCWSYHPSLFGRLIKLR
jgi:uncharacterized protein with von Willebrand factor type A (vWA) domain